VVTGREYHPSYDIPEYGGQLEETLRRLQQQAQEVLDGQVKKVEVPGARLRRAISG